jgi:hypothetical protein
LLLYRLDPMESEAKSGAGQCQTKSLLVLNFISSLSVPSPLVLSS